MRPAEWRSRILAVAASGLLLAAMTTALAAPAGAVTNLTIVTAENDSDDDDQDYKAAVATCPAGRRVIGAGGEASTGQAVIEGVVPTSTTVTVYGRAAESGPSGDWKVKARAVCADEPAGYEIVSADSGDSSNPKSEMVPCTSNKRLLGTGWFLRGVGGQSAVRNIDLTYNSVEIDAVEDLTGNSLDWAVVPYAICAQQQPGQEIISSTNYAHDQSEGTKTEHKSCPTGKKATGGGARVLSGGQPGIQLYGVMPGYLTVTNNDGVLSVRASEFPSTNIAWKIQIELICVTG